MAETTSLLMIRTVKGTAGSNPALSAKDPHPFRMRVFFFLVTLHVLLIRIAWSHPGTHAKPPLEDNSKLVKIAAVSFTGFS